MLTDSLGSSRCGLSISKTAPHLASQSCPSPHCDIYARALCTSPVDTSLLSVPKPRPPDVAAYAEGERALPALIPAVQVGRVLLKR